MSLPRPVSTRRLFDLLIWPGFTDAIDYLNEVGLDLSSVCVSPLPKEVCVSFYLRKPKHIKNLRLVYCDLFN